MRFANRKEAGQLLANRLQQLKDKDVVVYALPRGGVPLGVEIARALDAPLGLAIARKIGHPTNPEYAVCAVTETGPLICNELERAGLNPTWLKQAQANERAEAKRRRKVYLADHPVLDPTHKTVILADDGIATGLTMQAAIGEARQRGAAKVIVAVPVAPRETAKELRGLAADLVALDIPTLYRGSVGAYYRDFPQVTDQEVIDLLELARR